MKRTVFLTALVCSVMLIATDVSAQTLKPLRLTPPAATKAHAVTVYSPQIARLPKLRVAPASYSVAQRAAAVAATQHMAVPPDLSAPFSLTPGHAVIPGIARLAVESSYQIMDGGDYNGDPAQPAYYGFCGGSCFPMDSNQHIQDIVIRFQALAGKHYVFDCRIQGGQNSINYQFFGVQTSGGSSGTATIGSDNHVLVTTGTTASSGELTYVIGLEYFNDPNAQGWVFWGCDVSSF